MDQLNTPNDATILNIGIVKCEPQDETIGEEFLTPPRHFLDTDPINKFDLKKNECSNPKVKSEVFVEEFPQIHPEKDVMHLISPKRGDTPKNLSSDRPFSCEKCGKCFYKKDDLTNHLHTHSEDRPSSTTSPGSSTNVKKRYHPLLDGTYYSIISQVGVKIKAQCTTCNSQLSCNSNGITNLRLHLNRKHSEIVPAVEKHVAKYLSKKRLADKSEGATSINNPTLLLSNSSNVSQLHLDSLITNFIINGIQPLSTVEEPGFVQLIKGLQPSLNVTSRITLTRKLVEMEDEMKNKIKDKLMDIPFLCLTADIWSVRNRRFLGVTFHWINEDLDRHSGSLAFTRFIEEHTLIRVVEKLQSIIATYNISLDRITSTVTDNGSNFVKAFKGFGICPILIEEADLEEEQSIEEYVDETEQDLLQSLPIPEEWTDVEGSDVASVYRLPKHVRCAAHTLSLVATTDAKQALKLDSNFNSMHHSTMSKAQALWNKSVTPKSAEIIKQTLGCSLCFPCVTRWNSLYDAVLLLVQHKEKLNSVCQQLSIPVFQKIEIEFLNEFAEAVKPVAFTLDQLQGEKNSFYGELIPALLNAESKLLSLQSTGGLKYCTPLVDALLRGLTRRFASFLQLNTQDPQVVHAIIASTSHPHFKLRWLELKPALCAKEEAIKRFVITAMEAGQDSSLSENSASSDPDNFDQFSKRRKTQTSSEMMLLSYLKDPDSHLGSLNHHTAIKNVFLEYNTTLPSSAPVERIFSLGGLSLPPQIASLSDKMFERLVLLKSNNCCQ